MYSAKRKFALHSNTPKYLLDANTEEFVENADEVSMEIRTKGNKLAKYANKATFCIDFLRTSSAKVLAKLPSNINFKEINLSKILDQQSKVASKWQSTKKTLYTEAMKTLQRIKPCTVTSLYSAMLKQVYTHHDKSFATATWCLFTSYLREQWENRKSFPQYFSLFNL